MKKTTKKKSYTRSKPSKNKKSKINFVLLKNRKFIGLLFVLIFASIGAYYIFHSMAATPFPTSRNVYQWPFAQDSVWNMPIGSNAVYKPTGFKEVTQAKAQGGITVDKKYLGLNPNAPVKTLRQGDYSNHPKQPTTNKPAPTAIGTKVNVPSDMTADGKLNGAASLLVAGTKHDYIEGNRLWIDPAGSDPQVQYSWTARSLKDDGWNGGTGGGSQSAVGGTIRKGEITDDEPIRHALRLNVWGNRFLSRKNSSGCNEGYRWPALRADASYDKDPSHKGSYNGVVDYVCMGSLLAIKPNEDLSWITSKKVLKLAEAARDYGMYVVDNTAWDVWGLNVEASAHDEVMKADIENQDKYYQEIQQLILRLNAVTNNSPDSIGGGGTRRAPLAPCFDDEPNCPIEEAPKETTPDDTSGGGQSSTSLVRNDSFTQGVNVFASSQVSGIFSPSKAVDGNETTNESRWTSKPQDGESITIDLGKQLSINRIAFISAKNTTKQYSLMLSNDNLSYTTVASGSTTEGIATLNDKSFTARSARYIRFTGVNRWNNNYGHSIFEIGAYIDKTVADADFTVSGIKDGATVKRWIRVGATPSGVTGNVSFKYYVKDKEIYTATSSPYCLGGVEPDGICKPYDLVNASTWGKETFKFTVKMIYNEGSVSKDYTITRN